MINKKSTFLPSMAFLPQPLTEEEERNVLQKLSSSSNQEARNTLIEKNLRLVVHIANKFGNSEVAFEDLFSNGCIGLIKAASTFAIEKKVKFATYASRCIENEMLMYLRKNKKHSSVISLDSPLSTDEDGNELLVSNIVFDPSVKGIFEAYENKDFLTDFLTTAINNMYYIDICIVLYRLGNLTQKEIAKQFGWAQSYISRKLKKAFDTLRRRSDKNLTKTSNPKIAFFFDDIYFFAKIFKKDFNNIDKIWSNFLLTHSLGTIQLVQNTKDLIEICSDEEIFVFLADFLLYLHA